MFPDRAESPNCSKFEQEAVDFYEFISKFLQKSGGILTQRLKPTLDDFLFTWEFGPLYCTSVWAKRIAVICGKEGAL